VDAADLAAETVAADFAEQLLQLLANSSGPVILQQETASGLVTVAALSVAAAGTGATIEAGDAAVQVPPALVSQASELAGGAALLSIGNVAEDLAEKLDTSSDSGAGASLASAPLMIDFRDGNGTALTLGRLREPMLLELQAQENLTEQHTCAYWDEATSSWSTDGVQRIRAVDDTMLCSTTHLSIFAIIFQEALLALTCSTIAELLTAEAIQKIARPGWLQHDAAVSIMSFLALFCFLGAYVWQKDQKVEAEMSWEEREKLLFKQVELEKKHEVPRGCCRTVIGQIGNVLLFLLNLMIPVGDMNLVDIVREMANVPTTSVKHSVRRVHAARAGIDMHSLQVILHGQPKLSKFSEDTPDMAEVLAQVPAEPSPSSNFRSFMFQRAMSATESFMRRRDLHGHGISALEMFVDSSWFRRVGILFSSAHPWLVLRRICMFSTAKVRLALIFLKIVSLGAANAVFFSTTDPKCEMQHGALSTMVRNLTVGLATALLSDCIIAMLFMLQKVHVVSQDWTEEKKSCQRRRWLRRMLCFWTFWVLYSSIMLLYTGIFLANKDAAQGTQWLQVTGIGVLEELVLMPLAVALSLGTASSVILLLRPHLKDQVKAELIEPDEAAEVEEGICNEEGFENNLRTQGSKDAHHDEDCEIRMTTL